MPKYVKEFLNYTVSQRRDLKISGRRRNFRLRTFIINQTLYVTRSEDIRMRRSQAVSLPHFEISPEESLKSNIIINSLRKVN